MDLQAGIWIGLGKAIARTHSVKKIHLSYMYEYYNVIKAFSPWWMVAIFALAETKMHCESGYSSRNLWCRSCRKTRAIYTVAPFHQERDEPADFSYRDQLSGNDEIRLVPMWNACFPDNSTLCST